jgi:flagella basal body P-ring formation protein FlgA
MRSSASLLLLLGLVPAAAAADPPAALEARVADSFAARWSVPSSAVRLVWGRLPGETPPVDVPFRVTGRGMDGWFAIVLDPARAATSARVRAGVEDSVPVATRPLAAGARVHAGDVRLAGRVRWGGPDPAGPEMAREGWEVRRPLAAGEALLPPAVLPPHFITAGQPVRFLWSSGAVSVSLTGIALNAARCGEIVRARGTERATRLVGIAVAPGTATFNDGGQP